MKYEAPEIEVTRFELESNIMAPGMGEGTSSGGDNVEEGKYESMTTVPDIGLEW